MKIVSINVRGLSSSLKRITLFHWAKENRVDILCLQETFCTENNRKIIDNDWDGDIYHSLSDSTHSRGVSILIRKDFK